MWYCLSRLASQCRKAGGGLLDRYNRNLEEGMNMTDAVIGAGKSRFRAIILTTITTFTRKKMICEN